MASNSSAYSDNYIPLLAKNFERYRDLRQRIDQRIAGILKDPYHRTERLGQRAGGLDLRGCRSARVGRNFRIVFVICEECRRVPECSYCFCEGLPDQTVIFLTLGPHDKAYVIREAIEAAYG